MSVSRLRIATRRSPLALWQAEHVAARLRALHDDLEVELVEMTTTGDKLLEVSLANVGGKGLFVKELEQAMLDGRADVAVHSMKDVPVDLPAGLEIAAVLEREDPRDVFISPAFENLAQLPPGAVLGTSSLRRQCQLRRLRPDVEVRMLRGNVGTRLRKLDGGEFDAIVLAAAGVKRLGITDRVRSYFEPHELLPAIGQGAVGIECRRADVPSRARVRALAHPATTRRIEAERALNRRLHGGCQVPVAGYAEIHGDQLTLHALVGRVDGTAFVHGEISGPVAAATRLGTALADDLLARGAGLILAELAAPRP